MTGRGRHLEHDGHVALLGHTNQRGGLGNAGHYALQHQQAFVQHKVQLHATALEQGGHLGGATQATDFLVCAEGQVDGAGGLVAAGHQHLHRFELRQQVALVVPRAAAPDKAVFHFTGKRGHRPVALGAGRDGHHVLVGHQQNGFGLGVSALPGVEQAQITHHLALECRVGLGEPGLQQGVKSLELVGVEVGVVTRRNGLEAHCLGQAGRYGGFVHRYRRQRFHLHLARAFARGVDADRCGQHHYQGQQGYEYFLDHQMSPRVVASILRYVRRVHSAVDLKANWPLAPAEYARVAPKSGASMRPAQNASAGPRPMRRVR